MQDSANDQAFVHDYGHRHIGISSSYILQISKPRREGDSKPRMKIYNEWRLIRTKFFDWLRRELARYRIHGIWSYGFGGM